MSHLSSEPTDKLIRCSCFGQSMFMPPFAVGVLFYARMFFLRQVLFVVSWAVWEEKLKANDISKLKLKFAKNGLLSLSFHEKN